MIFQERDAEVLRWINGFGFASVEQIRRFMGVCESGAYRRIRKLVEGGYLERDRILHGQAKIHRVTRKGTKISGDALPPLTDINFGTFRHDLVLVDLALTLEEQTGGVFTPDRRIRHHEGLIGVGQRGHVADGYLHIGEDEPIAIELELTVKSRGRIRAIVKKYSSNLSIKEVWYYTDRPDVTRAIEEAASRFSFVKVRGLTDTLQEGKAA